MTLVGNEEIYPTKREDTENHKLDFESTFKGGGQTFVSSKETIVLVGMVGVCKMAIEYLNNSNPFNSLLSVFWTSDDLGAISGCIYIYV